MAADKKSSRGRFPYLFDWNAKSRKKLFGTNKPDEPDESNQGKEPASNLVKSDLFPREVSANGDVSIPKGTGACSSPSSVCGDDGYGSKSPGVVAKLMGLESLPTPSLSGTIPASHHESVVSCQPNYPGSGLDFRNGHPTLYSCAMPRSLGGISWNSMHPRLMNKTPSPPIERYQTEVLPPKTARPISITRHKLLSPIKGPVFVPSNDTANIIEAAARIIDSCVLPSSITKSSSIRSSPVPMGIRHLKDRANVPCTSYPVSELSQRPYSSAHSAFIKQVRGNVKERSEKAHVFQPHMDSDTCSVGDSIKRGGKVTTFPVQETGSLRNLQGDERSAFVDSKSSAQKDYKQNKLKQSDDQHGSRKNGRIRNSLNMAKQNSLTHRDRSTSKSSESSLQSRKVSLSSSARPNKPMNKVKGNCGNGSRKTVSARSSAELRPALVIMNHTSRSMNFFSKDTQSDETIADHVFKNHCQRDSQRGYSLHRTTECERSMDVISFTFTSPIKRSVSTSQIYQRLPEGSGHCGIGSHNLDNHNESEAASPRLRLNFISGDSLGLLLEKKLKELMDRVESIQSDSITEEPDVDSSSCHRDSNSRVHSISKSTVDKDLHSFDHDPNVECDNDLRLSLRTKASWDQKNIEDNREHSGCSIEQYEERSEFDDAYLRAFVNEYHWSQGSCLSSNSTADCSYGDEQPSSLGSQQASSSKWSAENLHMAESAGDISDAASSVCIEEGGERHTPSANYWESEYVNQIVSMAGVNEFRLDKDTEIIASSLFDQLEQITFRMSTGRNAEGHLKIEQKLVFDCITESIRLGCKGICYGSYQAWVKWGTLVKRGKKALVEELCRHISRLKSMGSLMLDELVDKDMSNGYERWLDFDIDTLEMGMEIEREIEASLVEEVILDILLSWTR